MANNDFNTSNVFNCKQGYTQDNIMLEFGKDDDTTRKCNGCNHFTYDGEICSCDLIR